MSTKYQSKFTFSLDGDPDDFTVDLTVNYEDGALTTLPSEKLPTVAMAPDLGDVWLVRLDLVKEAIEFGQTELTA